MDLEMVVAQHSRAADLPRADYFLAILSQQHLSPPAGAGDGGSPFWGTEIAGCS